jgi:hypothetical protein
MVHTVILKQLSHSNWEFEYDMCCRALGDTEGVELAIEDHPAGKNNKNRGSGKTLVAIFLAEPDHELIAAMRWRIHTRMG